MDKNKCLDLFERYMLGHASVEEVESLCSFINDDPHLNQWLAHQIMGSSSDIDSDIRIRMLDAIRSHTSYSVKDKISVRKKQSNSYYIRWIANIAAILFPIALGIGFYLYNIPEKIDYLTVSAGLGEKASIKLPDNSKVSINSASEIVYNTVYNKEERLLKLSGEAYFEVEPDHSTPFIVQCGDIKVKVIGTTFGISAYDDDDIISVVLNSGKVELITPDKTLAMYPNDKVTYDRRTKKIYTEQVDAADYVEWIQNRLRFENETLENIVKIISRMHNINISFDDVRVSKRKYTGTIDNTSIQSALRALYSTSPIDYKIDDGVIFLYEDVNRAKHFKE